MGKRTERWPDVHGELRTDTVLEHSSDHGNLIDIEPGVVLRPAHADDVAALIRHCAANQVPWAARGAHHTMHGQSLTSGAVMDMRSLAEIHSLDAEVADVDAGVEWETFVRAAAERGRHVASGVPGFLGLTIGGVLSAGGITTNVATGAVVDGAVELDVVTITGERVTCSPHRDPNLFHAVLAGFGRHGVIVRARLRMTPAPTYTRTWTWTYHPDDTASLLADMRILADKRTVDNAIAKWTMHHGSVQLALYAESHYDTTPPPAPPAMREPNTEADSQWIDALTQVHDQYRELEADGWEYAQKPWADLFLPDDAADELVAEITNELTPRDLSPTSVGLLFLKPRAAFGTAMERHLPQPEHGPWVWLLDILTDNHDQQTDAHFVTDMLARNHRWATKNREAGGTIYPIGAT